MNRVAIITPESFLDVDFPLISRINQNSDLLWVIVFSDLVKSEQHMYYPEFLENYCKKEKIRNKIIINRTRTRSPGRVFTAITILKEINAHNPDTIYFNWFSDPYLPVLARFFLGKRKTIIGLHDVELHPGVGTVFHRLNHWIVINLFEYFHVFSLSQQRFLHLKYPGKKNNLIRLFLKDFGRQNNKEMVPNHQGEIKFLFFGGDYPYKGLGTLIKAGNLLSMKSKRFKILIAGKCNNVEMYNKEILDKTLFYFNKGYVKSEEVPVLFSEIDYLVLPYRQVTQSGPLMIALNYNIPVIASDLDGFKEYIIDRETGFLFPADDAEKLASIMEKIISMGYQEHERMKANISKFVKREFNIDIHVSKYLDMFNFHNFI
jgi:glycosyltransferase involved in cell wall biosynthesis